MLRRNEDQNTVMQILLDYQQKKQAVIRNPEKLAAEIVHAIQANHQERKGSV